jgi:hypothetical protein
MVYPVILYPNSAEVLSLSLISLFASLSGSYLQLFVSVEVPIFMSSKAIDVRSTPSIKFCSLILNFESS